jgi:hypothetical protein
MAPANPTGSNPFRRGGPGGHVPSEEPPPMDTPAPLPPLPPATHRVQRSIRVPDDLWKAAQAKAAREYTTVTAVIIRLLAEWASEDEE